MRGKGEQRRKNRERGGKLSETRGKEETELKSAEEEAQNETDRTRKEETAISLKKWLASYSFLSALGTSISPNVLCI